MGRVTGIHPARQSSNIFMGMALISTRQAQLEQALGQMEQRSKQVQQALEQRSKQVEGELQETLERQARDSLKLPKR